MKLFKISIIFLLILYLLYFVAEYCFIPENINITAGEKYSINLNSPFKGEIFPQTKQTIYINDKPVNKNSVVYLNDDFSMLGEGGSASLKVKFMGITLKDVNLNMNSKKSLYAVGKTVGICVDTKGILVLGTGSVRDSNGKEVEPAKDILYSGDIITKINGNKINNKEEMINSIEKSPSAVNVTYLRKGKEYTSKIKTVKSAEDSRQKIGLWVRDSTQGIGTITYYDGETGRFGALGHPITDVDTGEIMIIDKGEILKSKIKNIEMGQKGIPGALVGSVDFDGAVGTIDINNNEGIYGILNSDYLMSLNPQKYDIGYKADVKKGKAYILANIEGEKTEKFEIYIDTINKYENNGSKCFTISVTDKNLLDKTGGIVQGMSGCPIIQNDKIIGAVTHVFVNNPTRGYGIFIENMIKTKNNY